MRDAQEIKKAWLMSTKRKPAMNINNEKKSGANECSGFFSLG